jgi:hypothetical protein
MQSLPGYEPTPNVATQSEILLADELRHRLEERYLAASDKEPDSPASNPDNVH